MSKVKPMPTCPFCQPDPNNILLECLFTYALWDNYPISVGHVLIVPKRHIPSLFNANLEEQTALLVTLDQARQRLNQTYHPDGYNIGINDGKTAGQTIPHLHIHLIPRYQGDCQDPRGGIRWIFPEKAKYW